MAARKKPTPVIQNDPLEGIEDADDTPVESSATETQTKPKRKAKPKAKAAVEPKVEAESVVETETSKNSSQINLGDSLGIQDVAQMIEEMMSLVDLGSPITIAGGEVERTDGAGLQLLCMLMKTGKEKGIDISWESSSDAIVDGARLLGLRERLQLSA